MTKEEKEIVLNGIHNYSAEIERLLPHLRNSCRFGLQRGKLGNLEWLAMRLHQLADEIEKYKDDDFTLEDMQDYRG